MDHRTIVYCFALYCFVLTVGVFVVRESDDFQVEQTI